MSDVRPLRIDTPEWRGLNWVRAEKRQTGKGAIILVEGLDGTGKSTLVTEVYKNAPAPVAILHAGPPLVTTPVREYVWPLGIANAGYLVLCDRWHLGECVWPEIFDRESLIPSVNELWSLEEHMKYLSTPILPLYMNRPLDDIRQELEKRDEPVDRLNQANWLYAAAIANSTFNWVNTDLRHGLTVIQNWLSDVC